MSPAVATQRHDRQGREPPPSPADRLHELARRVERLGSAWRGDPEQVVLEKLTLAREMRLLAREMEAG